MQKYLDLVGLTYFKTKILGKIAEDFAKDTAKFVNDAKLEDKKINFYHDQTKVAEIDAAPFYVDGMVQNVEVKSGKLVITFNTDAGKEAIEIEITKIFNPENYYDKDAIDGKLEGYAKTTDLSEFITAAALEGYVKEDALEDYVKEEDLEGYSKTADWEAISNSDIDGLFPAA